MNLENYCILRRQTTKQLLNNFEPKKPWKYKQFWALRSDPSCLGDSLNWRSWKFFKHCRVLSLKTKQIKISKKKRCKSTENCLTVDIAKDRSKTLPKRKKNWKMRKSQTTVFFLLLFSIGKFILCWKIYLGKLSLYFYICIFTWQVIGNVVTPTPI